MNRNRQFSPAEWQVLEYITGHYPVTAREAAAHFSEAQGWARTTTLTLMERLRKKGYLKRSEDGSVNQYAPAEPREEIQRGLIREFVEKALGGSISPLMSFIGQDAPVSDREIEELRRVVDELEARRGEVEP